MTEEDRHTFYDEPDVVRRLRHGVLEEARVDAGVSSDQVADDKAPSVVSGRHPRRLSDAELTAVFEPRHARRRDAGRFASHVDAAAFSADDERRRHICQSRRRCRVHTNNNTAVFIPHTMTDTATTITTTRFVSRKLPI